MMMEVNVERGAEKLAWAQFDLDFSTKTWSTAETMGRWGSMGVAKSGYMEMRPNGTLALGNQIIVNQKNVILIDNGPIKTPDTIRTSGTGSFPDPFNSNYADVKLRWRIYNISPLRQRILDLCKGILPGTPNTYLTPGKAPMTRITTQTIATGGVTNCGVFPGWVTQQIGGKKLVPDAIVMGSYTLKTGKKVDAAPAYVTSPMTAWEEFIGKLEKKRSMESGSIWTAFDAAKGNLPEPGDIYTLAKSPNGKFAHVGVVIDAIGPTWITADCGQGQARTETVPDPDHPGQTIQKEIYSKGLAAGYRTRKFDPASGILEGEFGQKAYLQGWVNIDRLFANWEG